MSETWTEYGVMWPDGQVTGGANLDAEAARRLKLRSPALKVVGRQVTASDWLPVQDQP